MIFFENVIKKTKIKKKISQRLSLISQIKTRKNKNLNKVYFQFKALQKN
jgi:hypothetical protein